MLTREQKQAIYEEYKDRRNKVEEIAKKYGVQRGEIAHIAVEMGAEPRHAGKYGVKHTKSGAAVRSCPKCRRVVAVEGAKFCCFCGADIRSNRELLVARIESVAPAIMHLPENMRDNMQRLFIDIIKELEGGV